MSYPAPVFVDATVTAKQTETPELTQLTLAVSPEVLAAYTMPGQYIQARPAADASIKPAFLALANGPGRGSLELLIKRGAPTADALVALEVGQPLAITAPAGKGYPLNEARGRDLFLLGVGSGIAPLRAVVHFLQRERNAFGRVVLIYGARTCQAFPYAAEMQSWGDAKIEIFRVCSQPAPGTWSEAEGRVQQVLQSQFKQVPSGAAAFVCGMKHMVEDVKKTLGDLGLPPERVFQNF